MAEEEESKVTPWEVSGEIDYDKLTKDFGVSIISDKIKKRFSKAHPLLRRGIYFANRDFEKWLAAHDQGKKVSVMTGRGSSGKMHIGHLVPMIVAKSLQDEFNCNVYIAISDDEKFYVKEGLTFEQSMENAKDNILDIIALGFDPKKTFIFQDFKYTEIYTYAARVAKRINYSTAKATFGLKPEMNLGWTFYPSMQTAHILFPQFKEGRHMTVVPVGIDQDPFIRLTRDIAEHRDFGFEKPAALHAKFIPSLFGGAKMSTTDDGVIFLSDYPDDVKRKINRNAFSGGQPTLEEHRKKGGNTEVDIPYQYLKMFFEDDDKKLKKIHDDYKSGKLLSGEIKKILIDKVNDFLKHHQAEKEKAKKKINSFLLK